MISDATFSRSGNHGFWHHTDAMTADEAPKLLIFRMSAGRRDHRVLHQFGSLLHSSSGSRNQSTVSVSGSSQ